MGLRGARILALASGGAAVTGALAWMAWIWLRTPDILREAESFIAEPVDPAELPPGSIDDLLAVEDPAFRSHFGIDLSTPGAGWTTITQGLAKDLYFDAFRPGPLAKLEQSLAALVLDARTSKDRQLRLFLGRVYLGETSAGPVNGFPAAARVWIGKDVRRLDRREFLSLVAMVIGPNAYGIASHPADHAERMARIERLLAAECRPDGWRDVWYEACATSAAEARR